MSSKFIGCRIMRLPVEEAIDAAKTAVAVNSANKVELIGLPRELLDVMTPLHLALLTNKYWGAAGVKLSVGFMDNPDQATRTLILQHMNAWAPRANVSFTESSLSNADVRIARTRGEGYWSNLGTDIRHIPSNRPTMNLEAFTASTPLSEYKRVVRHETGHTLGFPHEHMRKELVARIDPVKAKAYFLANDGWDAQTVQEQVLTPLDDSSLTVLSGADQLSIMCYQLPGSITKDGQPIIGGTDIDETDFALASKQYPPAGGPVSPPSPPPGPSGSSALFTFAIRRNVPQSGTILLTAKKAMSAGSYDVSHSTAVSMSAVDTTEPVPAMAIPLTQIWELVQQYGPVVWELVKKYGPGAIALIKQILAGNSTQVAQESISV